MKDGVEGKMPDGVDLQLLKAHKYEMNTATTTREDQLERSLLLSKVFPVHGVVESPEGLHCSCGEPSCGNAAGKHPLWFGFASRARTADQAQIDQWKTEYPSSNWAMLCDEILVIDIDIKGAEDGRVTLNNLQKQYGSLPPTLMAKSPSGGYQMYFRGTCRTFDKPGIDFQGLNVYVVLPGSRTPSGEYIWLNDLPIAPLPAWINELAEESKSSPSRPASAPRPSSTNKSFCKFVRELTAAEVEQLNAYRKRNFQLDATWRRDRSESKFKLNDTTNSGYEASLSAYAIKMSWDVHQFVALISAWRRMHGLGARALNSIVNTFNTAAAKFKPGMTAGRRESKGLYHQYGRQLQILGSLHFRGPATPKELSQRLEANRSGITTAVSRMANGKHTKGIPVVRVGGMYWISDSGVEWLRSEGFLSEPLSDSEFKEYVAACCEVTEAGGINPSDSRSVTLSLSAAEDPVPQPAFHALSSESSTARPQLIGEPVRPRSLQRAVSNPLYRRIALHGLPRCPEWPKGTAGVLAPRCCISWESNGAGSRRFDPEPLWLVPGASALNKIQLRVRAPS